MKIILMGPPGAGKGTQGNWISNYLNIPKVSSGDLFREHQNNHTELGKLASSYMQKGKLVPDKITVAMVMEWIENNKHAKGFVLDGYPRTLTQAEALDLSLTNNGLGNLDKAINVDVPTDVLISRLSGRLVCSNCSQIYNIKYAPPQNDNVCDTCKEQLYLRDDDKKEAIQKRIEVYFESTIPLISYYEATNILVQIDGSNSIDVVTNQLKNILSN
ncbi:MAG: adenylate kinase [SAR202 cluster bacterium]|nr:adenylate kinase [Chloroflexota bacterium]MQG39562.1 adenylate kinase [SAR202 cluster bacterium]